LPVVVDTGPLLAAGLQRDEAHRLAASLLEVGGRDVLVPDAVLVECDHLLRRRAGGTAARRLLEAIVDGHWTRAPLSASVFARAVEIDAHYSDLGLGIADASVMALAESTRGVILTFDFADFRAAPRLDGTAWDLLVDEREYMRMVGR
jgi:predicted nucleic acid-binding protein